MSLQTVLLRSLIFAAAVIGFVVSQQAIAAPKTVLILHSQPGDWVGGGIRQTFRPADGTFSVQPTFGGNGVTVSFSNFPSHDWHLTFLPRRGKRLARGQYEGAARMQSAGTPGLDVGGDGRGCGLISGRFLVSELVIDSLNKVQKLAVDFEQHCDNRTPALYGSVRYNSDISIEPRVSIGDATALKGNMWSTDATIVASLSMPSTGPVFAQFATADSTAQWGRDYQASLGTVVFPPGVTVQNITVPVLGNLKERGNRDFSIELRRPSGALTGDRLATVRILDPNVPMTVLTMNSQPGDYIGQGRSWLSTTADFDFHASHFQGRSVWAYTDQWDLHLAAPNADPLLPATYNNAQNYWGRPSNVPGLNLSGDGRGCSSITGGFTINQAVYGSGDDIQNLSADFEQHCEGWMPALFGAVRINAMLHQASITNAVIANSKAVFYVTLNPPGTAQETVTFTTANGTALAGTDYSVVSTTLTFAPGETRKRVVVPLLPGAHAGTQFYGTLTATKTPLWISKATARLVSTGSLAMQ